jgi:hypothetical protein
MGDVAELRIFSDMPLSTGAGTGRGPWRASSQPSRLSPSDGELELVILWVGQCKASRCFAIADAIGNVSAASGGKFPRRPTRFSGCGGCSWWTRHWFSNGVQAVASSLCLKDAFNFLVRAAALPSPLLAGGVGGPRALGGAEGVLFFVEPVVPE